MLSAQIGSMWIPVKSLLDVGPSQVSIKIVGILRDDPISLANCARSSLILPARLIQ